MFLGPSFLILSIFRRSSIFPFFDCLGFIVEFILASTSAWPDPMSADEIDHGTSTSSIWPCYFLYYGMFKVGIVNSEAVNVFILVFESVASFSSSNFGTFLSLGFPHLIQYVLYCPWLIFLEFSILIFFWNTYICNVFGSWLFWL